MANVTIKDVAKQANVSIATVSRVLNKNYFVSPELEKKVMDAKKRLIFVETKSYDYMNENRRSK